MKHPRKKAKATKKRLLPHRPSKYVGVTMHQGGNKLWQASISIDGIKKNLGYYHDEKEAARMYDDKAALHGRPVNFPLHEGMEQAVKPAPKRKDRSKLPNVNRPSKYVGVTWDKRNMTWKSSITVHGQIKHLINSPDEKEAARIYDEQAALHGRPVNFPLHEGMEQAVKAAPHRRGRSHLPDPNRPSKYVGVSWHKTNKQWQTQIKVNGKSKGLGFFQNEKEAARMYDEQAALLGKPVNFPLHEGMAQAVKPAPKGSGRRF